MRTRCVPILLAALAATLAGCNRYPDPSVEPDSLPPIPEIGLTGLNDDARRSMETAVERAKQYRGDALVNGELGMLLHAHRRYAEAAVMYDRAGRIHSNVFRWQYYRGVALGEINDVAEAGASLKRALELQPNDPHALLALAQLYFKSAALAENEALLAEGERTLALLIETNPDYLPGHLVRAARLEEAGQNREAIAIYDSLLAKGPAFGVAHQSLSRLHGKLGDSAAAERHQALAKQSKFALPGNQNEWMAAVSRLGFANMDHAARGFMLMQNGLSGPAAEEFELAAASDPSNVHHRVNLVALYGLARNFEKAQEHYQAALRLGGAEAKVHLNMGTIELGQGRLEPAEAAYNRALAADGAAIKAHLGLARIATVRQNLPRAEGFIRQALALEPLNPLVYSELMRVLRAQGRLDEAAAAAEKGVAYSEGKTAINLLRALADIHRDNGNEPAALAALERARTEAERAESNVDLALIDAQLADYAELAATP